MVFTKIEFCQFLSLKLAKQGPKVYRTLKKRFYQCPSQVSLWDGKSKTKGHKFFAKYVESCQILTTLRPPTYGYIINYMIQYNPI